MLRQFRNVTRGWIATIIVGLVGLATVLFLIPNSGMNLGGGTYVAEVGGRQITPNQLTRELDLTLRAARNNGADITREEAVANGEHRRLLEGLITRVAMYWYGDKVGVSASNAQVAEYIRQIPAVLSPVTGNFDENAYAAFLQQMGYTRNEFERDVRGDITTQTLMEGLVGGVRAPSSFGALLYTYTAETRVVSIAEAPASAVGAIPQPNEAQLQAFYEDNQERLRLPEFRGLTLVYARAADFAARIDVPEARLREEFDARAPQLTQPERRTYVRIAAPNEAQANDAAARLNRGETAAAVAAALGLQATRGEDQPRSEVPDTAVADAVFRAQVRGPALVARGSLSPFVVVKVESSTPAVTPNFAEVRQQIHDAIAADEAHDALNAAISAFEEARAGGATLAEAARANNLPVVTISAIEAEGRDQSGQPVEALAGHEDVLATAFQTPEGEATDFIPAGDADVVAGVDRVIPESVRPLDEVRAELTQAWIGRERARRLTELGEQIVTAVRGGQTLAAAARANRANLVVSSRPLDRASARGGIPAQGMAGQIFAAQQGGAMSVIRNDGGAVLVAVVEQINRPNAAEAPQIVEGARLMAERPCVREALQQGAPPFCGLVTSTAQAIQDDIVDSARPRRNETLIDRLYANPNAEGEDAQ